MIWNPKTSKVMSVSAVPSLHDLSGLHPHTPGPGDSEEAGRGFPAGMGGPAGQGAVPPRKGEQANQ